MNTRTHWNNVAEANAALIKQAGDVLANASIHNKNGLTEAQQTFQSDLTTVTTLQANTAASETDLLLGYQELVASAARVVREAGV